MKFISGKLNGNTLDALSSDALKSADALKVAIAYANFDQVGLFQQCADLGLNLDFYGRYDGSVAIDPELLKWFLDKADLNLKCRLVPDIFHSKVIWWVGYGAYIGSANLTRRAWHSNIEVGVFIEEDADLFDELSSFFVSLEDYSEPLRKDIYLEQKRLKEKRQVVSESKRGLDATFESNRLIGSQKGLSGIRGLDDPKDKSADFRKNWNQVRSLIETIADVIELEGSRPPWIPIETPKLIVADQFLSLYYDAHLSRKKEVDTSYLAHKADPKEALKNALSWWKQSDYEYTYSKKIIDDWSVFIREHTTLYALENMDRDTFIGVMTKVHAFRAYAKKSKKDAQNLGDEDLKSEQLAIEVWDSESEKGRTPIEVLKYVIWGAGDVSKRIWKADNSSSWKVPKLGLNTLCEIVGWANPEKTPPFNTRSRVALKALGHDLSWDKHD